MRSHLARLLMQTRTTSHRAQVTSTMELRNGAAGMRSKSNSPAASHLRYGPPTISLANFPRLIKFVWAQLSRCRTELKIQKSWTRIETFDVLEADAIVSTHVSDREYCEVGPPTFVGERIIVLAFPPPATLGPDIAASPSALRPSRPNITSGISKCNWPFG